MNDFAEALAAAERDAGGRGIGTLGEKTLHLALKYYCAPDPETHERPLGGFVADAVTEEGVFEIQTRSLYRLKPKLDAFLPFCPVTVVHPVIAEKHLIRVDPAGELLSQRRSPKHETVYTAMEEIVSLRDYLTNPQFRILLCELELTEYSVQRGKNRREKRDRIPTALLKTHWLETPADYAAFLPDPLPDPLTAPALAAAAGTQITSARAYLNLLVHMEILAEAGRSGRYKCWKRSGFHVIRR